MGKFFSPQHGVWQNGEKVDQVEEIETVVMKDGLGEMKVFFDERNVAHVVASTEEGMFFLQGYLHARDRLWQMDFNTYLASGRLSEIVGKRGLDADVFMRKVNLKGLAEEMLVQIEKDPVTKNICDYYTMGVNEYISKLSYSKYPIEYKLYSYKPEKWTNFKTALLLKYFAFQKTGFNEDFKKTLLAKLVGEELYGYLYPVISTIDVPVFHSTADFEVPEVPMVKFNDKLNNKKMWFLGGGLKTPILTEPIAYDMEVGTSTWAVSPQKTQSGKAILCNSWGSALSIPNVGYEVQLQGPGGYNVYGVSYPGVPCVMSGFNSRVSWGMNVPNVDVKDYYEIEFENKDKRRFVFNQKLERVFVKEEVLRVKNGLDVREDCLNTFLGPVVFVEEGRDKPLGYVLKWTIQEASNELKAYYLLNRMKNYEDFKVATTHIVSPVVNVSYADVDGNIGLILAGKIPVRADYQGDFVLPARDSLLVWQYSVPNYEKPKLYNPSSLFVFSNNQMLFYPSIFPYYLGSTFNSVSSKRIYDFIIGRDKLSVKDMMRLQNDNYSTYAETLVPLVLDFMDTENIDDNDIHKVVKILQSWNFRYDSDEAGATVFELLSGELLRLFFYKKIYIKDNRLKDKGFLWDVALIQVFQNAENLKMEVELKVMVAEAFRKIADVVVSLKKQRKLDWGMYKKYVLRHNLVLNSLSVKNLVVETGNDKTYRVLNGQYGVTGKMVVHFTSPIEAYVSFAGGSSGNAGSNFYRTDVKKWVNGDYAKVVFLGNKGVVKENVKLRVEHFVLGSDSKFFE